jgi:hypothetical protein
MEQSVRHWLQERGLRPERCLRENFHTTYQLEAQTGALRISKASTAIADEVALLQWLRGRIPALDVYQYAVVDGWAILHTAWIAGSQEPVNGSFASTVRLLHSMRYTGALPRLQPAEIILQALEAETHPRYQELVHNAGCCVRELSIDWGANMGIVHGDVHPCNTVTDQQGRVHLIDFERVSRGNTDWDCALVWTACNRMGDGDWSTFCEGYGDPRLFHWTATTPIVQLAQIWAFSWCCGRETPLPEVWHQEMLHRFEQWRDGGTQLWNSL